jgi:hypothetical protein
VTEDMRARIAQTIYRDGDDLSWAVAVQLADLIIWELGLRRETAYAWNGSRSTATGARHVTDWEKP